MRSWCVTIVFIAWQLAAKGQVLYSLDASRVNTNVQSGYFKMGSAGPVSRQLLVNSRYLTIGGKPVIPVMGELQYSRMPRERWEDEILKMKAGGVTIIATYVFWIHHEEIEGLFDWSGDKDLRSFVKLCQRLGVLVYPRIGPWAHGDVRNGGTPDWILRKKYLADRSMDPVYQQYVERYFRQIGQQLKGLMYKDGGPVAGIQLENEYWKGRAGEPYIYWLKQTAIKNGMDVPLYTVTGWGDGSVPKNEVIPLWGGYPDESWTPNIEKISGCGNYTFNSFRDDATIGNAQVTKKEEYDYSLDPYFTCEMGVGIFNSIHRRPVIGAQDGLGMIISRIGSGGNLLGYYVFAGGSNPIGVYSTMEENKDETGYWSELSPVSYDFQAAIRENGLLAPSYYEVKRMNYFLDQFGEILAPMEPVFPGKAGRATGDKPGAAVKGAAVTEDGLQYAVRVKDNSGFLFGINYCRGNSRQVQRQVRFKVQLKDQVLTFPSQPVDIPDSSLFFWPMNLDMDGVRLNYATVQPLFHGKAVAGDGKGDAATWVFVQDGVMEPELSISEAGIEKVELAAGLGEVKRSEHAYVLSRLRAGSDCVVTITRTDGRKQRMIVLSREEGRQAWILADSSGLERFFLSRATLYTKDNSLYITDTLNDLRVRRLDVEGNFVPFDFHLPQKKLTATLRPVGALDQAQWLETSVAHIDAGNLLYHKQFQKEFSCGDPARIRSAKLVLAGESECRVRVNGKWVDQPVRTGELNVLDITGYVGAGDNVLLMDFPFAEGKKAFAARVLIEYFNTDRLDFSTDTSWLMTDQYYFPATYGSKEVYPMGFGRAKVGARRAMGDVSLPGFSAWVLPLACDFSEGLNNVYMEVDYQGDRISVRSGARLIADNLNNNLPWLMDLKRRDNVLECGELQLEVRPWKDIGRMYFDRPPPAGMEGKAGIGSVRLVPEYRVVTIIR